MGYGRFRSYFGGCRCVGHFQHGPLVWFPHVLQLHQFVDFIDEIHAAGMTTIHAILWKYLRLWPFFQVIMNYRRKSTTGFSIYGIFADFTGGLFSMLQMLIDGYNFGNLNIISDESRFLISLVYISNYFSFSRWFRFDLWRSNEIRSWTIFRFIWCPNFRSAFHSLSS